MIELFTAATPNGHKVSIALEELGLPYELRVLSLSKRQHQQDWFVAINPNGRIPAIVDHGNDGFAVFESGAILMYLAERTGQLIGRDGKQRSRVMQWLMFQMGGVGPMMGQASVFRRQPEKIQFVIDRFQGETQRLLSVLDRHLQDHEYLADDYSVADIANWTWARLHEWTGVSTEDMPHLRRWITAIADRPAVQRGLLSPPSGAARKESAPAVTAQKSGQPAFGSNLVPGAEPG